MRFVHFGGVVIAVLRIGSAALVFAVSALIIKSTSASESDTYIFLYSLVLISSLAFAIGTGDSILRDVAALSKRAIARAGRALLVEAFMVVILSIAIFAPLFITILVLHSGINLATGFLALVWACFQAIRYPLCGFLRATDRVVASVALDGLIASLLTCSGLAAIVLAQKHMNITIIVIIWAIAAGTQVGISGCYCLASTPKSSSGLSLSRIVGGVKTRAASGIHLMLGSLVGQFADHGVLWMLAFHGVLNEPTVFGIALQVFTAANMPYISMLVFISPAVVRLFSSGKITELRNLSNRIARAALAFFVLFAIVLFGLGDQLLGVVFGPKSVGAAYLAGTLCIFRAGQLLFGISHVALPLLGKERMSSKIVLMTALVSWLIVPIAYYFFGLFALGVVCGLRYVAQSLLLEIVTRRELKFSFLVTLK